ncbi:MAG: iron-sulfur cluster assembly accessory protein [Actinomycetota bacterium]|nr:iron-sulfur cluster assembly accessory protein [Actinomycetota bacterium]
MDSEFERASSTETVPKPNSVILGATAVKKVAELLEREGNPDFFLRVAVQPGGCSGLRYALYFDDEVQEGDVITSYGSVFVRVDRMSAPYLKGATIDWLEGLDQSGFTINNPNAAGSCACGDSFH